MDIEEFYDADPRRRESEETEFGREWSDANGARTVLGTIPDRARVDEVLAGWEGQMGKPNSLQWVRDQLSAAR